MDFRESVRVIWPGEVSGVVARAVNLSPAGILVDAPTPTPCPVGSDVLCDVTLPRGPRLLRGRVAHRRQRDSEKVGMGIEFIDLSPLDAAELRDIVGEGERRPQRVKVRFEGTNQIVRARALATEWGFRLATALPFLRASTEVDIALSPDESVTTRGWVAGVALDFSGSDGVPRLVIDVEVARRADHSDVYGAKTPVVEVLSAVPERVWEPEDLGMLPEPQSLASLDAVVHVDEETPTVVTSIGLPPSVLAEGALPAFAHDSDATQIIAVDELERRRWTLAAGVLAGLVGIAIFAIFAVRASAPRPVAFVPSLAPPVIVTEPSAPAEPPAAPAVALDPAPADVPAPPAASAAPEPEAPSTFSVGLSGSLAGANRYPIKSPDGVGFNLPQARATMKVGTYHPPVPGVRQVWVRALPGGGTHLRFYFKAGEPAPRVELGDNAVTVSAP